MLILFINCPRVLLDFRTKRWYKSILDFSLTLYKEGESVIMHCIIRA